MRSYVRGPAASQCDGTVDNEQWKPTGPVAAHEGGTKRLGHQRFERCEDLIERENDLPFPTHPVLCLFHQARCERSCSLSSDSSALPDPNSTTTLPATVTDDTIVSVDRRPARPGPLCRLGVVGFSRLGEGAVDQRCVLISDLISFRLH